MVRRAIQRAAACLLLGGLVSVGFTQPVLAACIAETDPARALTRMLDAHHQVSYRGTLIYERASGRQFFTVEWPADGASGELTPMNAGVDPMPERWSPPTVADYQLCALLDVYVPTLDPGRVVSGRATQRLTLRPRDTLRHAYVAEIDERTGMALSMATVAPDGKVLDRFEFAAIEFLERGINDGAGSDGRSAHHTQAAPSLGVSPVPGYFVVAKDDPRSLFVVSDGLATASIFIEPLPPNVPAGEGAVLDGATLTYSRGIIPNGKPILISVLGEIPITTARLLADAVSTGREIP